MRELIRKFLDTYAIRVSKNEDIAITELYMDNCTYIEYEDVGYYLPENNSLFDEEEELMLKFLNCNYRI